MLLALVSAGLLILAFPPFELWFAAWFALVPLLWAIERETDRGRPRPHVPEGRTRLFWTQFSSSGQAFPRSFILGWLFGNVFFFGTCWWLTYAPIHYASFPAPLAYFLLFCVTSTAAVFPGIFAAITAFLLRRFGSITFLAVPFVWVFTEFARYWLTGNNWNAIGYSMGLTPGNRLFVASYGGVLLCSFYILFNSSTLLYPLFQILHGKSLKSLIPFFVYSSIVGFLLLAGSDGPIPELGQSNHSRATVVALQPNVPMSGLLPEKWRELRKRHVQLAESAIETINERRTTNNEHLTTARRQPTTVIFPESPMNFMYGDDPETQEFINGFARKNNVSVLFNSAEPNHADGKYFNSAVMVGPDGKKSAQYDKIYLLPFGEAVPFPFDFIVPAFVGSFSYGNEYDLLPLGDAKAGVMICFESHFGQLSREYVRNGADVIIEMTNDGYLGPTPVLRQHLANAVFRAVETNRPVLRVTNVGITAYINERGEVLDAADSYVEATRVWSVAKSDGSQTFYVKYGDWFAWLCSIVTIALLIFGIVRQRSVPPAVAGG
ncbi:MAG: apolipoprotein N-acyltransferase [Chloracidobacterium sp.]|nr:apolipoprotein N-acyltransferase [Chloracidobacterium sp.]